MCDISLLQALGLCIVIGIIAMVVVYRKSDGMGIE
jgi:hypothetical protein